MRNRVRSPPKIIIIRYLLLGDFSAYLIIFSDDSDNQMTTDAALDSIPSSSSLKLKDILNIEKQLDTYEIVRAHRFPKFFHLNNVENLF